MIENEHFTIFRHAKLKSTPPFEHKCFRDSVRCDGWQRRFHLDLQPNDPQVRKLDVCLKILPFASSRGELLPTLLSAFCSGGGETRRQQRRVYFGCF
ncbi:hypothetical protein CEXT_421541 [Caerostris extrusa]|uniref:Uncharacterized protein n=1 Tax=Caerostris extrusa TaxID=172846 RepID=A0AAV4USH6_CAEEX|nr:hypothetical protein CEXT_421541 [Caerostris extrusa]